MSIAETHCDELAFGPRLEAVTAELRDMLSSLDTSTLSGEGAARVTLAYADIERLAAAGKTLAAGRVAETGFIRESGYDKVELWLASKTKASPWEAAKTVETARHLGAAELRPTRHALVAGELTATQAHEIATAASGAPQMQEMLLASAKADTTKTLKERCRQVRLARRKPEDERQRRERLRAGTCFKHRDLGDGLSEMRVTMPTAWFARLLFAVRDQCDAIFAQARQEGRHDPHQLYMVEALMALVFWGCFTGFGADAVEDSGQASSAEAGAGPFPDDTGSDAAGAGGADTDDGAGGAGMDDAAGGQEPCSCGANGQVRRRPRPPRAKIICRIDWSALQRGHAVAGETCDIPGIGPVSVETVRELLPDAVIAFVVTKGVAVHSVTHLGRRATSAMYSALQWQTPLCTNIDCDNHLGIEVDHRIGWADTLRTRLDELDPLCRSHCHRRKTREGWELVVGEGRRPLVASEHPDHPRSSGRPPPAWQR